MPNPAKTTIERTLTGVRLRRGADNDVTPIEDDGGDVVAPDWLDPEASGYFEAMVALLREKKLLTMLDAVPIAIYAEQLLRFTRLKKIAWGNDDGTVPMLDAEGNQVALQQKPAISEIYKLQKEILAFHDRFGGSPKARTSAKISGGKPAIAGTVKNGHATVGGEVSPEFMADVEAGIEDRQAV